MCVYKFAVAVAVVLRDAAEPLLLTISCRLVLKQRMTMPLGRSAVVAAAEEEEEAFAVAARRVGFCLLRKATGRAICRQDSSVRRSARVAGGRGREHGAREDAESESTLDETAPCCGGAFRWWASASSRM